MNTDPVRHRLGRRGAYLLTAALVWWCEAGLILLTHTPVPRYTLLSRGWQIQCAAWLACGTVMAWSAFRRQGRDAPGWVAMYVMAAWIVLAIGDGLVETAVYGTGRELLVGVLRGCVQYGVLGWLVIASGWREPITFSEGGAPGKDGTR